MGRHHIDEVAALRRVELLEVYVAGLQESFDALKAKVEAAAAATAEKVGQLEPLVAQMDALAAFVDEQFLAPADPAPAPASDAPTSDAPTSDAPTSDAPTSDGPVDPAAPAAEPLTGGWHPQNP